MKLLNVFSGAEFTSMVLGLALASFGIAGGLFYWRGSSFNVSALLLPLVWLSPLIATLFFFLFNQIAADQVIPLAGVAGLLLTWFFVLLSFLPASFCLLSVLSSRKEVSHLFFIDMTGALFGILFAFFVVPFGGPVGVFLGLAVIAFCMTLGLAEKKQSVINGLLLGMTLLFCFMYSPSQRVYSFRNKYLSNEVRRGFLDSKWGRWGRLDLVEFAPESPIRYFFYDGGTIGTNVYYFDGDYKKLRSEFLHQKKRHFLRNSVVFSHYLKRDQRARVFQVGVGAGQEIKAALMYGASEVFGSEINSRVVSLSKNELSSFNGNIFNDPRVSITIGDSRQILKATKGSFDIIQSFSTYLSNQILSGGAAGRVNYLFTKEALAEFISRLKPDGILQLNQYRLEKVVDLLKISWESLGLSDFENHILLIGDQSGNGKLPTVLLKKSPWTEVEVKKLSLFFLEFKQNQFQFLPLASYLGQGWGDASMAPSDGRPFFAGGYTKFKNLREKIFFGLLFFLGLLLYFFKVKDQGKPFWLGFFALIGFSYLVLELTLVPMATRLFFDPTLSASVVLGVLVFGAGIGSLFTRSRFYYLVVTVGLAICLIPGLAAWVHGSGSLVLFLSYALFLAVIFGGVFVKAWETLFRTHSLEGLSALVWIFNCFGVLLACLVAPYFIQTFGFYRVLLWVGSLYSFALAFLFIHDRKSFQIR